MKPTQVVTLALAIAFGLASSLAWAHGNDSYYVAPAPLGPDPEKGAQIGPPAPGTKPDIVDVTVPSSALGGDQGVEQISVDTTPRLLQDRYGDGPRFEIGESSWVPRSLSVNTSLADPTTMHGSGVPQTSLTLLSSPIGRWRRLSATLLAGVSFGVFSRSATYPGADDTPSRSVDENFYLIPIRLGAQAQLDVTGPWSLYGGLAVVPMFGFTTHTIFDDGQQVFGIPLEATLGLANDLRWVSSSLRGVLVRAGVDATGSAVTAADFSGLGAQASLSIPL